jgi:hypothetical protein
MELRSARVASISPDYCSTICCTGRLLSPATLVTAAPYPNDHRSRRQLLRQAL